MRTTRWHALLVAIAAVAAIAWILPQTQQAIAAQQVQREGRVVSNGAMWVYRVEPVPGREEWYGNVVDEIKDGVLARNAARNERLLNQRAAEGWEFTAVAGWNYYFRRPK